MYDENETERSKGTLSYDLLSRRTSYKNLSHCNDSEESLSQCVTS